MPYPPNTPLARFGVETLEQRTDRCVATAPVTSLVNPLTGAPTIAPLALLVDHVGGLINHLRRPPGQWPVSSELALEVSPGAVDMIAAAPATPLLAIGRPLGRGGTDALSVCELRSGDTEIGTATVRTFYIAAPADLPQWSAHDSQGSAPGTESCDATLGELMALQQIETDGAETTLLQGADPALNNQLGVVHGGISSMGLELAASAELNRGAGDPQYCTASLRVNFLRPFYSGGQARYVATRLHLGRSSGVADARAVGSDGRTAMVCRVTAYRSAVAAPTG